MRYIKDFWLNIIAPQFSGTAKEDMVVVKMVEQILGVIIMSGLVLIGIRDNVKLAAISPTAHRELGIAV